MLKKYFVDIFGNIKISKKIIMSMILIDIILTIFLCGFTRIYFNKLYYEEVELQTKDTMNVISNSLIDIYDTFLFSVINFLSSEDIQNLVIEANSGGVYSKHLNVQNRISNLVLSNDMIDAAFLINNDGTYYTRYSYIIRPNSNLLSFLDEHKDINEIIFLPNMQSPFLQQQDIIPIIVPLATISPGENIVIANKDNVVNMRLIVLLNLQKFQRRLSLSGSTVHKRNYMVLNSDKEAISINNIKDLDISISDIDLSKINDKLPIKAVDDSKRIIYLQSLPFSNLKLLSVLSKDGLNKKINNMNRFIFILGLVMLFLAILFSGVLSNFITGPLNILVENINKIQRDEYDIYHMKYNDEIGKLNYAINNMYNTIQSQIKKIKLDEYEKYQLELKLLSEQINPHLLYNALENINLEVLNNNTFIASKMINNLATFMRIGLNYGGELIAIEKEIEHVRAYINIMKYRFNTDIDFYSNIDEKIRGYKILRFILQPLVENSILHGFLSEYEGEDEYIPKIDINFTLKDAYIFIEVCDNGKGIDIEKAESILNTDDKTEHIGLKNIYNRLKLYYGTVEMSFESIPFFRNKVIIKIFLK